MYVRPMNKMTEKKKKLKIVFNTYTCESHKMGSTKKYPVNASGLRDGPSGICWRRVGAI